MSALLRQHGLHRFGNGDVLHVPCVQAGHWIFGTGLRAIGADGLMDANVLRAGRPLDPPPKAQREAAFVFARMQRLLGEAGGSIANVVRLDQYYTDPASVDPYHVARRQAMAGQVAPSTSIITSALLNTDAALDVQALAFTDASGYKIERFAPQGVNVPASSGYAPCVRAGPLVFVAGQIARDSTGALAAQAMVPAGQLWNGTRIKLETDYLVSERLMPALAAAQSSLDLVVKAQVYLTHPEDLPAFWESWSAHFGKRIPPTTIVPVNHPALGSRDATIEVNLIAAHESAREAVRDIDCDVALPVPGMLPGCAIDGLLFVAGLMAVDHEGLVPSARIHATAPYFHDAARAQMEDILAKAAKIFAAAGSDLAQVTRLLQFHTSLADFHATHLAWREAVGGAGAPFSAIEVAPRLFMPGARLICDFLGAV